MPIQKENPSNTLNFISVIINVSFGESTRSEGFWSWSQKRKYCQQRPLVGVVVDDLPIVSIGA